MPARKPDPPETTTDVLAPFLATLAGFGLQPKLLGPRRRTAAALADPPTAWVRIAGPRTAQDWAVVHQPRLEPAALGNLAHRLRVWRGLGVRGLLFTRLAPPRLAARLRAEHIAFVDAAGNAFLDDDGLFVWVTGQRPEARPRGERRAIHAAGIRLLYVLLRGDAENATQRELARRAGIALGGVGGILRQLELRGWVVPTADGARRLAQPDALLRQWEEGYAHTLRPKLVLPTCRRKPGAPLDELATRVADADLGDHVQIGGELGAALWTRHLRPARAALHLRGIEPAEAMRRLELVPDRAGDVDLLAALEEGGAEVPRKRGGPVLADPLLVRAEILLHPDDRLTEVAELLRADEIAPRWGA